MFITALTISGLTALPLNAELHWLKSIADEYFPGSPLTAWLTQVYHALVETGRLYPFLAYGHDWLAFAHITIAIAFIGPLMDPVRNVWVIHFGMIACLLIMPTAFIAGHIRQIPFWWQLIDCSFGLLGLLPLWVCRHNIKQLEVIEQSRLAQLF